MAIYIPIVIYLRAAREWCFMTVDHEHGKLSRQVEQYKLEHGVYPERLDQVVKGHPRCPAPFWTPYAYEVWNAPTVTGYELSCAQGDTPTCRQRQEAARGQIASYQAAHGGQVPEVLAVTCPDSGKDYAYTPVREGMFTVRCAGAHWRGFKR